MGGCFVFLDRSVQKNLVDNGVVTRREAGPGLWLSFLLPTAILLGELKKSTGTLQYRVSACLSAGIFIHSCLTVFQAYNRFPRAKLYNVPGLVSAALLLFLTPGGFMFSIGYGALSLFAYDKLLLQFMKLCPKSFSYGEASVVTQAFVLFIISSLVKASGCTSNDCMEISSAILQVGILCVIGIGFLSYVLNLAEKPKWFYILAMFVIIFVLLPVLSYIIGENPLIWVLYLFLEDSDSVSLFGYWLLCSLLGVLTVIIQLRREQNATTVIRKIFHVLTVLVFVPGIILKPCLIYLASGVVLAVFMALDMMRVLRIPPLGDSLQSAFNLFADEKDEGPISLTPFYLLVGCALPLWIHPNPAQSDLLPLLAGLLSVGIGDTAASACGTWVGKNKWPGSKKTKEGTAACFLSQLFLVIALIHFGYVPRTNLIKPTFAIAITSLVEANTDQVDNLALPLLMYILSI